MASNESIKSILNKLVGKEDSEDNTTQITSQSLCNCANTSHCNHPGPSTANQSEDSQSNKSTNPKRTKSEPCNLNTFLVEADAITFRNALPETSLVSKLFDNDTDTKKSTQFALRFQSELLNIPNRSNVTLKSCIRFRDDLPRPHRATSSNKSESLPPQNSTTPDRNDINADIAVLYSDNISFASSESLIAKDSMGQSRLNIHELRSMQLPRRTDSAKGTSVCTTQPPPYHVATAHDTASVQLTPTAALPVVLYSAPPLQGAPPTYSALMHIGPQDPGLMNRRVFSRRDVEIQSSSPFIAPPPPPSYAQAQGYCVAHPLQFAGYVDPQDSIWNTEPVTVICPFCNNFVVTSVRFRRSNLTHYSALALCICGCWPCCLMPYCMKSCKCAHHECPVCSNVVGVYSPWQVA